jgi:hypothetical protein
LINYRDQLDAFRKHFFTELSFLSKAEVEKIKNARIPLLTHDENSVQMTLMEAVHQYTVSMSLIVKRNMSELVKDPLPLSFIQVNKNNNIAEVWDNVCNAILLEQVRSTASVLMNEFICMISAISLVVLAAVSIFFPAVYRVNKQRADIYSMFEKIEPSHMQLIYSQCVQRLKEFGGENGGNNMDLEDLMEMTASKKSEPDSVKRAKIRVTLSSVLMHKLSLGVIFILSITLLYFLGYYLWWSSVQDSVLKGVENRVYLGVTRKYYTRKLMLEIIQYNPETKQLDMNTDEIKNWEQKLWKTDHAIYYGDLDLNITTDIRQMQGGETLLNENMCDLISKRNLSSDTIHRCKRFMGGVLTQNSHEVVVAFVGFSQDLRKTYNRDPSNPEVLAKTLTIKELADDWFPLCQDVYNSWIQEVFVQTYKYAAQFRQTGTIFYILVCTLSLLFVYLPLVRQMNWELAQTRNLLLIIPTEVLESSKVLKETVKRVAIRMLKFS